MLGAFLTVASGLGEVVARWTQKVQVIVYLTRASTTASARASRTGCRTTRRWRRWSYVSREQALARFREMFRDLSVAARGPGREPLPGLDRGDPARRAPVAGRGGAAGGAFAGAPGVNARSSTTSSGSSGLTACTAGARGGRVPRRHPRARGRLHDLERDPPDDLRAGGRARHHAPRGRDPRLREGPVRDRGGHPGRLGGLVATGLLWTALGWLSRGLASSDLVSQAAFSLRPASGCCSSAEE